MYSSELLRRVKDIAKRVAPMVGPVSIVGGLILNGGDRQANPNVAPQPTRIPGISSDRPAFVNPFADIIAAVDVRAAAAASPERRAMSLADTLSNLAVDAKDVEKAGTSKIQDMRFREDANGNIQQMYFLDSSDHKIKTTKMGSDGKFEAYKSTSALKLKMENPRSFDVSADGQTIVMVGENPIRSSQLAMEVSTDGGKTFTLIPSENLRAGQEGSLGSGLSIKIIPGTHSFMVGTSAFEGKDSLSIVTTGATPSSVAFKETGIKGQLNVDLHFISSSQTETKVAATGNMAQTGISLYTINIATGISTSEQITTVKVAGQDVDLGYMFGIGEYTDGNGHKHVISSDQGPQTVLDIDLSTKTASQYSMTGWLAGKVDGYSQSSVPAVQSIQVVNDHVFMANWYRVDSSSGATTRSGITEYKIGDNPSEDTTKLAHKQLVELKVAPQPSQESMQIKQINGEKVAIVNLKGFVSIVPIGADGNLDTSSVVTFPVRGLADAGDTNPTRILLPIEYKNAVTTAK